MHCSVKIKKFTWCESTFFHLPQYTPSCKQKMLFRHLHTQNLHRMLASNESFWQSYTQGHRSTDVLNDKQFTHTHTHTHTAVCISFVVALTDTDWRSVIVFSLMMWLAGVMIISSLTRLPYSWWPAYTVMWHIVWQWLVRETVSWHRAGSVTSAVSSSRRRSPWNDTNKAYTTRYASSVPAAISRSTRWPSCATTSGRYTVTAARGANLQIYELTS